MNTQPLRVGIGGPVGSGKTALTLALCQALRDRYNLAVVTNDIYTQEDAQFLVRSGALAPERIVAAALMQPSGFSPEHPDLFYQNNITGWGPPLCEKRPELNMDMVHDFLTSMYTDRADFVFTVSRDYVSSVRTPMLIAPDNIPAHPYSAAMEVAGLAPNSETTIFPWKDTQEHIDEVVEHARRFLKQHQPVKR